MRRNFNGVGDLIVQDNQELMDGDLNFSSFTTLADSLRSQWKAVEWNMEKSKESTGSYYTRIVALLKQNGRPVSESTLRTTVMRIRKEKTKSKGKSKKVIPPIVEIVEEIKTAPHQGTVADAITTRLEESVEPPVADVHPAVVDEQALYASYIETGSIADEFEVNDDSVSNFDWEAEIIRLPKRDGHISRAWNGWDKRLFNVLLWIAIKNKCTIRMVSSIDSGFFFDDKKTECFNLFVTKADQHQQDINIPKEFAS